MVDDVLLTPATYRVLERVPSNWFDEQTARDAIARSLGLTVASVTQSLSHLCRLRLVERRRRNTIAPVTEIRRIGRE